MLIQRTQKRVKKSQRTKERILAAARAVFAKYSYEAGSIRMIAKEGGFDFGIIRYHFPSKADLFETVMEQACNEFQKVNARSLEGVKEIRIDDGFSLYLDRILDHYLKDPTALRILMNNIYLPMASDADIPGYHHLPRVLGETRRNMKENIAPNAPVIKLNRFHDGLTAHMLMLLGASSCHAGLLGLEMDSPEYFSWVKKTLIYVYLPHLKQLIHHKA